MNKAENGSVKKARGGKRGKRSAVVGTCVRQMTVITLLIAYLLLQILVIIIVANAEARIAMAYRARQDIGKNLLSLQANGFEVFTTIRNTSTKESWTHCSVEFWDEFAVSPFISGGI